MPRLVALKSREENPYGTTVVIGVGVATGVGMGVGIAVGSAVGVGRGVGDGFTMIPPTTPAAAAPPMINAMVPMARAAPPAAKPTGLIVAPVAAENTVTSPGGPKAATLRSPQSSFFSSYLDRRPRPGDELLLLEPY